MRWSKDLLNLITKRLRNSYVRRERLRDMVWEENVPRWQEPIADARDMEPN